MFKQSISDKAVQSAEVALENTQRAASNVLDSAAHALDQGVERAREASHHLRESAQRASQGTSEAISHDPVKSVLIAAATGAALMALVTLLTRPHNRH
jgi:ElaB/YqjD/DUF883 family membrane-anchored ribosome-binding protein